jgi:hypothetical protein
MTPTPSLLALFGDDAARYVAMIDALSLISLKTRYSFTGDEDFKHLMLNDPTKGMQIFWREILARSHLTAVTAILRGRRWISGLTIAAEEKNLLTFGAAFRGLIESAADAYTALYSVPRTLARDHAQITRALSGTLEKTLFLVDQIEDQLIHFSYARHLTKAELKSLPASYKAKQVREYIDILERGQVPGVVECYRAMCDLTHPGASSVWMWLRQPSEHEVELAPRQEESAILQIVAEYRTTFMGLLPFVFNPAIVTLRVLNYFPLPDLHVPSVISWELSGIPLWQNCLGDLNKAAARICVA